MSSDFEAMHAMAVMDRMGGIKANGNVETPELAKAIDEIHRLRKVVAETNAAISEFVERMLVGERALMAGGDDTCAEAGPAYNSGVTGQLRQAIYGTTEIADNAMRLAARLRQIG